MTTFSANVNTPAQNLQSTINTALVQAQTLAAAISPASIGGLTLSGLATTSKNWRYNVADSITTLASAIQDLDRAADGISRVTSIIGNIATLD